MDITNRFFRFQQPGDQAVIVRMQMRFGSTTLYIKGPDGHKMLPEIEMKNTMHYILGCYIDWIEFMINLNDAKATNKNPKNVLNYCWKSPFITEVFDLAPNEYTVICRDSFWDDNDHMREAYRMGLQWLPMTLKNL